jgi:hypothetical protein
VFNNFQDIILTPCTIALVTNIVVEGVMMKEKPNAVSHDSKFFASITKSSFINLYDSFDKNEPTFPNVVVPDFVDLGAPK